jgi:sulfoxide reductase heme-binding subunit YedZ
VLSSAYAAARRRLWRVSILILAVSVIAAGLLPVLISQTPGEPLSAASAHFVYGYLNRSTGAVALVLLTLVLVLGVLNESGLATLWWPRFVIHGLHRNVALLAVSFTALHVLVTVFDGYPLISLVYAVIPIHSAYSVLWLGVGAVSFDLLIAVLITSLVRARLGYGVWRAIHWLAYACWATAVGHTLGLGNDLKAGHVWIIVLTWVCIGVAAAAVAVRIAWAVEPPAGRQDAGGSPRVAVSAPDPVPLPVPDVGAARHHTDGAPDAHPGSGQLREGGGGPRRLREGGPT